MVVVVLFLPLLIDCSSLRDAGIVGLPFNLGLWWEGEDSFHRLSRTNY